MTTYAIRRKIGTPFLFDPITGIDIALPAPFQIVNYHAQAWNGGSADGRQYMHIERTTAYRETIPTILADGDLNMYLASTGKQETIAPGMAGLPVAGEIAGQDIKGYLVRVQYSTKFQYLVFVATFETAYSDVQKQNAIAIAQLMKG